jgi:hypothetical protein
MDKLKNKKKDVITLEGSLIHNPPDNDKKQNILVEETKIFKNEKEEISEPHESNDISSITQKIKNTENNNITIKKILFKIQLLLSMTNKLDSKILSILSQVLSEEHLKGVLEERDSRGICGNLSCGSKLNLKLEDSEKYYYNFTSKDFSKDSVCDFFCDVKCYQKFKDVLNVTKNFDYLRLLTIDTIYLLSILKEFYADNSYLEEISILSTQILSKQPLSQEYFSSLKEKYTKFFL